MNGVKVMENQMQEAEGEQRARSGRRAVHYAWAAAGFAAFGLGALGAVLPVLPTTPFLLVAAFCFARSSERLNAWFRSTKLYRTVLEGYVAKRSMTVNAAYPHHDHAFPVVRAHGLYTGRPRGGRRHLGGPRGVLRLRGEDRARGCGSWQRRRRG